MKGLAVVLACCFSLSAQAQFLNAIDLGFVPNDPSVDNSPFLNKAVVTIRAQASKDPRRPPARTIYFPGGRYHFNSKASTINEPLVIIGDHINSTVFVRNYQPAHYADALIHSQSTIVVEKLAIHAAPRTYGGGAILLDGLAASASILRDLYITYEAHTAHGNWAIPITLQSSHPDGIRGVLLDNVEVFAATEHLAWFVNVRGLTARINAYPAGGSKDYITVQGSHGYRSGSVDIQTRHLRKIFVYDTDQLRVRAIVKPIMDVSNSRDVYGRTDLCC